MPLILNHSLWLYIEGSDKSENRQVFFYIISFCAIFLSFFFYWHYNPQWVLTFSVMLFHSALFLHWFLHCLIPIICTSLISAIHLFPGFPQILVPVGFHSNILVGVLLSSIHIMWPCNFTLMWHENLHHFWNLRDNVWFSAIGHTQSVVAVIWFWRPADSCITVIASVTCRDWLC